MPRPPAPRGRPEKLLRVAGLPAVQALFRNAPARVERLVFGAFDEKAGAVSSLWDVIRDPRLNHRVEVVTGIEADASGRLLRAFFEQHR